MLTTSKLTQEYQAQILKTELNWLAAIIRCRLRLYFKESAEYPSIYKIPVPELNGETPSAYTQFLIQHSLNLQDRIVLLLALAPYLKPEMLDDFFVKNSAYNRSFTEFGGTQGINHKGFIPTGETALFLLAGDDLTMRISCMEMFDPEHVFYKEQILHLDDPKPRDTPISGALKLSREAFLKIVKGKITPPRFSSGFPAKQITTHYNWSDLVLNRQSWQHIEEIKVWLRNRKTLMEDWGFEKKVPAGFRTLFYGPSGTGKTLTATLLGKELNQPVFKIDLSSVVSKYIGETEKNLEKIFNQAENKNWILFFDEADSLFGKRGQVSDARDRYANQEVSYLLQRIEDYNGLVILATNLKSNMDDAFIRRFQAIVPFLLPRREERLKLWQNAFSNKSSLSDDVNLREIAAKYELSGSSIMSAVRHASLLAIDDNRTEIHMNEIYDGIQREYHKSGRVL